MKKALGPIVVILIIFGIIGFNSITYAVAEDEVALIKEFGKIVAVVVNSGDAEEVKNILDKRNYNIDVVTGKGIHFKKPFIQSVQKYTSKYLTYASTQETINTKDRRKIDIMMFAQYRIMNPAIFEMTLGSYSNANKLMDDRVYPVVIQSANMLKFDEFFDSKKIREVLAGKTEALNKELKEQYGLYAVDIGIHRKNFPSNNIASIEEKMSKEIQKESQKLIAEGDSEYNKSEAMTKRIRQEKIAEAMEKAASIKAEADAEAARIFEESVKKDVEFYRFIQYTDMYKNLKDTTIFMDNNSKLLEYITR